MVKNFLFVFGVFFTLNISAQYESEKKQFMSKLSEFEIKLKDKTDYISRLTSLQFVSCNDAITLYKLKRDTAEFAEVVRWMRYNLKKIEVLQGK